jgi:predicted GH43/DUF377 family glycosyl hydrolase
MAFSIDRIVFTPEDVDLGQSPLRRDFERAHIETYPLGVFNPGLARLPNGNILLMVRVAEALKNPIADGHAHAVRWTAESYKLDPYPIADLDLTDPRKFQLRTHHYPTMGLTSLSWLLPVEMDRDGLNVVRAHYDKVIAPRASYQEYGIEDARISLIDGVYYMTACSVSSARHGTSLYTSSNGLDWDLRGLVLDHQNKDMLYFEGRIGGQFWALTRPLGSLYFLAPPDSDRHAGPAIHLATSPDGLHWKPHAQDFIQPRKGSISTMKLGGGAQPIRTPKGWLMLYHGVEPKGAVGVYRTFWALMDGDNPANIIRLADDEPLLEERPELTAPLTDRLYLHDIVFTTGIADGGDHYIVASGENDLACRITHIPKQIFV